MLLGFKPQFKEPIQIGTKVFTMRNHRKVMPKIQAIENGTNFKNYVESKLEELAKTKLPPKGAKEGGKKK